MITTLRVPPMAAAVIGGRIASSSPAHLTLLYVLIGGVWIVKGCA
jgi:hypothetical protein